MLLERLARHYGILLPRTLSAWAVELSVEGMIAAASSVGFDVAAGRLDSRQAFKAAQLTPFVAPVRVPEPGRFLVLDEEGELRDVGENSTLVIVWRWTDDCVEIETSDGDRVALSRDDFESRWSGVLVAMQPGASVSYDRLRLVRPFVSVVACVAILALGHLLFEPSLAAGLVPPSAVAGAAIAAALVLCTISARPFVACEGCRRATRLVGNLPLARAGAIFYLLVSCAIVSHGLQTPEMLTIHFALGGHLALLSKLGRARVRCPVCIAVAALVAIAASVANVSALSVVAAVVGIAVAATALRIASVVRVPDRSVVDAVKRALRAESAEPRRARVLVFLRERCGACKEFEERIIPLIRERAGEHVTLESRRADQVAAPTAMFIGTSFAALIGVPSEDDVMAALEITGCARALSKASLT